MATSGEIRQLNKARCPSNGFAQCSDCNADPESIVTVNIGRNIYIPLLPARVEISFRIGPPFDSILGIGAEISGWGMKWCNTSRWPGSDALKARVEFENRVDYERKPSGDFTQKRIQRNWDLDVNVLPSCVWLPEVTLCGVVFEATRHIIKLYDHRRRKK